MRKALKRAIAYGIYYIIFIGVTITAQLEDGHSAYLYSLFS